MIPISQPAIGEDEIQDVVAVLRSGHLVQGPKVEALEQQFSDWCGVKHAVAVNSGTAALHIALHACGIGPGDEVITTPFTFVATANAILMTGARPVFADIDERTFNVSPESIERALSNKTKAILPVNLFGYPADYRALRAIAERHSLRIVEDAAQSVDAVFDGRKSGNLGDVGCFSFYATKNLMAGEGGMITTNDPDLFERARLFRHHGQSPERRYEYSGLGYNYRMSDVHATIALGQLRRLKQYTEKRREYAALYSDALRDIHGIVLPKESENVSHVFHQYTIRILSNAKLSRDGVQKMLMERGIQSQIYYPKPLFTSLHLRNGALLSEYPTTERMTGEVLSIPVHPALKREDVEYISHILQELLG